MAQNLPCLLWFLESSGVFSHTSLQSPRKEISRNHFFNVIAFLHIYFTQLPFKHPVTHCKSVAHQHIFNYLAELGTSHARKWIAPIEHCKRVTERYGLMRGLSTAAASAHTTPRPLSGTHCWCTGLVPHHNHGLMVPSSPQSEQSNVPVDPTWDEMLHLFTGAQWH